MTRLNRTLAAVLAAQVLVAGLVWSRGDAPSIGALEPVAAVTPAGVTRVQIFASPAESAADAADATKAEAKAKAEADPARPAIDLVKRGDGWVLASHFDYPADPAKVTELVDKLAAMKSRGPVAEGGARARQLEVADDDFQRKLILTGATGDVALLIGAAAGPRKAAVRLAGDDRIHGVPGVTAFGISTVPGAYADPVYAAIEEAKVAAVTVTNARGTFALTREGDGWAIAHDGKPVTPPAGEELDTAKLATLVGSATRIELAAPADPARTIEQPEATIVVRMTPAGDGAAAEQSVPDDERTFDVASDAEGRYLVRERGNPRAALVEGARLRELVELDRARLSRKPDAAPPPGAGGPAGMEGMEGLPPEILEQLRQQGAIP